MKYFMNLIGGAYEKPATDNNYSNQASDMIESATQDIPDGRLMDFHTHVFGTDTNKTGNWVNPSALSLRHPVDFFKAKVFLNASGVKDLRQADHQYLENFMKLIRGFPKEGKFLILALDLCYGKDGEMNLGDTKIHVSNDYVFKLSNQYPDVFVPCISVHPYRKDALEEVDKWARHGVKVIKWMPGAMGMDASDKGCEPFYEKMMEHDMILLTHTGREDTMPVAKFQPLNNPLLFRKPLDMGVKIIMAHCGSLGTNKDLDNEGTTKNEKLFYRLMEEEKYEGLLYGDISALAMTTRSGKVLERALRYTHLHQRLINGSDYPLPAVNSVISINKLTSSGFLEKSDKKPLREIYSKNPLLFDFVLKRRLQHPENKNRFPASIFTINEDLLPFNMDVVRVLEEKSSSI
jgi:uncharacterized protein